MSKLKDFSRYPQITTKAQPSFFGMYISVWLTELQSVCTLYFTAPFNIFYLDNLQCKETLTDHTPVLMSLICWDQFLLSCLLDNTVKVWSLVTIYQIILRKFYFPLCNFYFSLSWLQIWAAVEAGNLKVTYTHKEEHVQFLFKRVILSLLVLILYVM